MDQNPQNLEELFTWLRDGELERFDEGKWALAQDVIVTIGGAKLNMQKFRRKPAHRPYTAEEITRGPVEFWAAVMPIDPVGNAIFGGDKICSVSDGYRTLASVPKTNRDCRTIHFREVLPPMPLCDEEAQCWAQRIFDGAPARKVVREFATFLHARESSRFEKGGV